MHAHGQTICASCVATPRLHARKLRGPRGDAVVERLREGRAHHGLALDGVLVELQLALVDGGALEDVATGVLPRRKLEAQAHLQPGPPYSSPQTHPQRRS